jgi:hypothetical protein
VILKRSCVVGSLLACNLAFTVTLAQGRWSRDGSEKQIRTDKSDLQRDDEQLAADVNYLRKSLRQHKSQELITQLRYQVRQDWQQIVLDRGHSVPDQVDRMLDLVNRRHKRNAQNS